MIKRKLTREQVPCECGCGTPIWNYDNKWRRRRFVYGHQFTSPKSDRQRAAAAVSMRRNRQTTPWNKGRSYLIGKRTEYAHKGAWTKALKRLFPDACMRCGWNEAPCDAHHLTPRRDGGRNTLDNGILLCPNCHRLAEYGKVDTTELMSIRAAASERCERR